MASFSVLSILLVLLGMSVSDGGPPLKMIESPPQKQTVILLKIQILIPPMYIIKCIDDEPEQLQGLIDKVVTKKFEKYYEKMANIYSVDSEAELCSVPSERRELKLDQISEYHRRSLQGLQLTSTGWTYQRLYKCDFCNNGKFPHTRNLCGPYLKTMSTPSGGHHVVLILRFNHRRLGSCI